MEKHVLKTKEGDIIIKDINDSLLKELQSRLPFGFSPLGCEYKGAKYGFVFQCGENELYCVKQQPVEYEHKSAVTLASYHFCMILESYCQIKDFGYDMIYYASPYLKEKAEGKYESGIAHFIFPGSTGPQLDHFAYDGAMGKGATALLMSFLDIFKSKESLKIPYIGLDLRTRSQLGGLISGFMLYKDTIIYLGTQLSAENPCFSYLAKLGIKEVVYAPSVPMTITPDQLNDAKGME